MEGRFLFVGGKGPDAGWVSLGTTSTGDTELGFSVVAAVRGVFRVAVSGRVPSGLLWVISGEQLVEDHNVFMTP